jgi:hypothetical protein
LAVIYKCINYNIILAVIYKCMWCILL